MKIFGSKIKQIKNGVHFLPHGGVLRIGKARYRYNLPEGSIVIPEQNLVYTKSFKGTFEWEYLPQKDFWIIRQISETETKLTEIDLHNLHDKCLFRMVVAIQEYNRVFVFHPTKDGDTVKEWRYFTDFFTSIIRNDDIT